MNGRKRYSDAQAMAAAQNAREKKYWHEKLSGNFATTTFPRFLKPNGEESTGHKKITFKYDGDLFSRLQKLSRGVDHTLHMILVAGVTALLFKYGGLDLNDVVVVMPIYKQKEEKLFINTLLVLRHALKNNTTFKELLLQVKDTVTEAVAHQDYPLGVLAEELSVEVGPGEMPFTDVFVLLGNIHDESYCQNIPGILLSFLKTPTALEGSLTYDESIYHPTTVSHSITHLRQLLSMATEHPDTTINRLEVITREEREQLLKTFNQTAAPFPSESTIHGLFEEQVERDPEGLALVTRGEEEHQFQHLTYGGLNAKANHVARQLVEQGMEPGTIVGIMIERSTEMMVGILAILKAGGAYLPLDPLFPDARLEYILADSGIGFVLTTGTFIERLKKYRNQNLNHVIDLLTPRFYVGGSENPNRAVSSGDPVYVIYTSGSTGRPKGVMLEHHSVVNRLCWMQRCYPLENHDVILHKTPFIFDVSVWELFWWGIVGASVCFLEPGAEGTPAKLIDAIETHNVTTMHFVPSMLGAFLEYIKKPGEIARLCSLRRVFASGEALPPHRVEDFNRLLWDTNNTRLINLYGPTEAAVDVSGFDCSPMDKPQIVPIGKPIDNIELYILNRHRQLQPVGIGGELCIAGVGLARGYMNRPEMTAEKFRQWKPVIAEGVRRIYHTGDFAMWLPDGNIQFLGRLDHQVKIRGFRIELGEIECQLSSHQDIAEAVVTTLETREASSQLWAYYTSQQEIPVPQLKEFLAEELPEYMVPAYFVWMSHLPVLPNGKIDRSQLPIPDSRLSETPFIEPRTAGEETMAEIWAGVLEVEKVGIHHNFFSLGGDSIRAILVVARAQEMGIYFSSQQLYQYPTIEGLMKSLDNEEQAPSRRAIIGVTAGLKPFELLNHRDRSLIPDDVEDAYPLTMLQAGLIFHSEMSPGTPLYHDIMTFRLKGRFHQEAFEKALRLMIQRHAILRTTYDLNTYSQHLQLVHKTVPLPLELEDLGHLTPDGQEEVMAAALKAEEKRCFQWNKPQLVRIIIHILGDDAYRYTLSIHDSTLDGWSVQSFNTELFKYYSQLSRGETIPELHPLESSYRDFVALEQESMQSSAHRQYWNHKLSGTAFTRLPRWNPEEPGKKALEIRVAPVAFSPDVSEGLQTLARMLSLPLKSILLAAHLRVLSVFSGNNDVLTGLEHNGRLEVKDGEKVLGLFLNTIPFRIKLEDGTWANLIRDTYRAEMEMLPHRRFPMALLKQENQGQPLFETVFNYTNFHVLEGLKEVGNIEVSEIGGILETEFPFRAEFSKNVFSNRVFLTLHYDIYEFGAEEIDIIGRYYARVLEAMSENSGDYHHLHPAMSKEEQGVFLARMNDNRADFPSQHNFSQLFEDRVQRTPDSVAVMCEGTQKTYAQLNRDVHCLANALAARNIGFEQIVAVIMDRGILLLTAILALFKRGAVYLPIEPRNPIQRTRDIIDQSDCRLILTTSRHPSTLENIPESLAIEGLLQEKHADCSDQCPASAESLAYVIYTSGSTGTPKGAMIEYRGMLNHLYAKISDLRLNSHDIVAQNASQSFDISIWQFLVALLVGGKTAIYPDQRVLEPRQLIGCLREDNVTILEVVPSYLTVIMDILETGKTVSLPSLRYLMVTGETVKPAQLERWFNHCPEIPVVNAYGPTEASDDITHFIMTEAPRRERVPIGKPVQNLDIYIVDRHMQLCPVGVKGEICVSGVGVGRGYLKDHGRTAEVFMEDPFAGAKGVRLYKTGDLGCWLPDGNIDFFGRKDHQVKIRGYRIELGDIEGRLVQYPGVKEAVVVDREDEAGNKYLCAYLTPSSQGNLEQLKEYLMKWLPIYMIPAHFITLDNLPLTPNGKIDRKVLPHPEGAPGSTRYIPPENQWEEKVVNIWSNVLGVEEERIGVHHHFFDLGGNSITLMTLANRINNQFQTDIKIVDFFNMPTVKQITNHLVSLQKPYTENSNEIEEFEL